MPRWDENRSKIRGNSLKTIKKYQEVFDPVRPGASNWGKNNLQNVYFMIFMQEILQQI